MKTIEYYYNIIYYFFYRGVIKVGTFITTKNPLVLLIYFYYKIPSVKQKWKEKGVDNPFKRHIDVRIKKFVENPKLSLATYWGATFSEAVLVFLYLGIYHILENIFFPTNEYKFLYVMIVIGALAYATDFSLSRINDQGVKYIKEFNAIKDKKWRLKWAIITGLSIPLSICFVITTSSTGMIGKFLMNLHHQESANSILYRPDESAKRINDLIIKQ